MNVPVMSRDETILRLKQMRDIMIDLRKLTKKFCTICEIMDADYDYRKEIGVFDWLFDHIGGDIEQDLDHLEYPG